MSVAFMRFNQEWQSGGSLASGSSRATSDSPNPWTSRLKYNIGHERGFELIEACLQVWTSSMSCLRLMLRKLYNSRVAPMVPKSSALIAMSDTQRPHESQNITIERLTFYSKPQQLLHDRHDTILKCNSTIKEEQSESHSPRCGNDKRAKLSMSQNI